MKLAIVIPTYNEAETISSLIKELFEKIKHPNGYLLKAKSPKTNIVYYINEEGKLITEL